MSPFRSKSQQRAAFAGFLGPKMKEHADMWAHETPNLKELPNHVSKKTSPLNKFKAK